MLRKGLTFASLRWGRGCSLRSGHRKQRPWPKSRLCPCGNPGNLPRPPPPKARGQRRRGGEETPLLSFTMAGSGLKGWQGRGGEHAGNGRGVGGGEVRWGLGLGATGMKCRVQRHVCGASSWGAGGQSQGVQLLACPRPQITWADPACTAHPPEARILPTLPLTVPRPRRSGGCASTRHDLQEGGSRTALPDRSLGSGFFPGFGLAAGSQWPQTSHPVPYIGQGGGGGRGLGAALMPLGNEVHARTQGF